MTTQDEIAERILVAVSHLLRRNGIQDASLLMGDFNASLDELLRPPDTALPLVPEDVWLSLPVASQREITRLLAGDDAPCEEMSGKARDRLLGAAMAMVDANIPNLRFTKGSMEFLETADRVLAEMELEHDTLVLQLRKLVNKDHEPSRGRS